MWIPSQMESGDRFNNNNNLSILRRPSRMETLSSVLRPAIHESRGRSQYSDEDGHSPYAERMGARFKSWYPGKEDKVRQDLLTARGGSHLSKLRLGCWSRSMEDPSRSLG